MYGANAGEWVFLIRYCERYGVRLAAFAALGAALALGGCGRKGPLDPPPSAAISQPPSADQPSLGENNDPSFGSFRRAPPATAAAQPTQPATPDKRTFILDPLIK